MRLEAPQPLMPGRFERVVIPLCGSATRFAPGNSQPNTGTAVDADRVISPIFPVNFPELS